LELYKNLKREAAKHIIKDEHQNKESKSPENNLLIPILVCSFLVIIVLVGLVLIAGGQRKTNIKRS